MNYIKHLNAVFQKFSRDPRLNPTHISLYMALFQLWNISRFPPVYYVHREELMTMAKIGSKGTYHRCLKNLHQWSYIVYLPSHNPYKSSRVKLLIFGTTSETTNDPTLEHAAGQAEVPLLKQLKTSTNFCKPGSPKNESVVLDFFKSKNWPSREAKKFFNHYNALGWKKAGNASIINWQSLAQKWMLLAQDLPTSSSSPFKDHLKINQNKDYDQPL